MRQFVIVGDFGVGNAGDDAILLSWLARLSANGECEGTIIAPKDIPNAPWPCVPWRGIRDTVPVLARADLVLVGGGGLFHDHWALTPANFLTSRAGGPTAYLTLVGLAKALGRPCFLMGIGVGPLNSSRARHFVGQVLAETDLITVRDRASFSQLRSLGCPANRQLFATADPVFALPVHHPQPAELFLRLLGKVPDKPIVVVALRNWEVTELGNTFLPKLAAALDAFLEKTDVTILLVPFQHSQGNLYTDDAHAAVRVFHHLRNKSHAHILPALGPTDADAVISYSQLVLAMRFHAAVMAFRSNVPCLAFDYDPKLRNLFADASLSEYCMGINGWERTVVTDKLLDLLDHPPSVLGRIQTYERHARSQAEHHFTLLDESPGAQPEMSTRVVEWRKQAQSNFRDTFPSL